MVPPEVLGLCSMVKKILGNLLPLQVKSYLRSKQNLWFRNVVVWHWRRKGCKSPPPHQVKQMVIEEYQKQSGYSILIETGTYLGDMVEAQKNNFRRIISIELDQHLYQRAKDKFAKNKHIEIYQGASSRVLLQIMTDVKEPAIFWLDGHYSEGITAKGVKETPIYEELTAILNGSSLPHILLIDDARLFTGEGDYPTIKDLSVFIKKKVQNYEILVKEDIIRMMPPHR